MKIGRIKEIKNIGAFADFKSGGPLGFEKLTFIYGLNTYGKTTLTDIFQSLKQNNQHLIFDRQTIPFQGAQKITLTEKEQNETDVVFQNNEWGKNKLKSHLEIFGSDFIYKNLFTSFNIERKNKENFTQFVLGEEGVKISIEIKDKKQELGEEKRLLKKTIPVYVKDKSVCDIERFINFPVNGLNLEEIKEKLAQKISELKEEKKRLEEPQKILKMEEPDLYKILEINIISQMDSINNLLKKDYSEIKDDILEKLKQHLELHFSNKDGAENWLKKGISYCKDQTTGNCPFCGQKLSTVQELINIYHLYFNESYIRFIAEIENGLSKNFREIENSHFAEKTKLQTILAKANKFKDLITDSKFQESLDELEQLINKLDEDKLKNEKVLILKKIKIKNNQKNKIPYKKIDPFDLDEFKESMKNYKQFLIDSQGKIKEIKIKIERFKNLYQNTEKIQEKINQLDKEVKDMEYKKARIEGDENCKKYIDFQKRVETLDKNISYLQNKLEKDQSEYLEKYFSEVNDLFKKFGSRNFSLQKKTEKRGNMTVYSLEVKFRKKNVKSEKMRSVFSDSDRRALALAVFLAKINLKEGSEKSKLIVILDDPITSFDDNRITYSINLFKDMSNKTDQMIILTHYPQFIKRFCEISQSDKVKLLKIGQNDGTSFLEDEKKETFMLSEHEKNFNKIYRFINKSHSEDIKGNLRPFLESHLKTVFAKKIKDENINCKTLKSMIDGVFKSNEDVKNKIHIFRESLNPDSHITTSHNEEDVRHFAREMMDYLYSNSIMI